MHKYLPPRFQYCVKSQTGHMRRADSHYGQRPTVVADRSARCVSSFLCISCDSRVFHCIPKYPCDFRHSCIFPLFLPDSHSFPCFPHESLFRMYPYIPLYVLPWIVPIHSCVILDCVSSCASPCILMFRPSGRGALAPGLRDSGRTGLATRGKAADLSTIYKLSLSQQNNLKK